MKHQMLHLSIGEFLTLGFVMSLRGLLRNYDNFFLIFVLMSRSFLCLRAKATDINYHKLAYINNLAEIL